MTGNRLFVLMARKVSQHVLCLALLAVGSNAATTQKRTTNDETELEAQYTRLTEPSQSAAKDTAEYFLRLGDPGARFLAKKLNAINAAELKFLGDSPDPQATVEWWDTYAPKLGICLILGEMFKTSSPEVQALILRALESSFTPSEKSGKSLTMLNWPLLRVGPDAMPTILRLANHRLEHIRCYLAEALEVLSEEFLKQGNGLISPAEFPAVDCRDAKKRRIQLKTWQASWKQYRGKLKLLQVPSFLEILEELRKCPDEDSGDCRTDRPPRSNGSVVHKKPCF